MIYTDNVSSPELMAKFCENKKGRECYSKCMTPNEALEWWANSESLLKLNGEHNLHIRYVIMQFLLQERTQSGVERTFSRYKRYASPLRNGLNSETVFDECLIAACKRNNGLFKNLRTGLKSEKKPFKKNESKEERDKRHGYYHVK